MKTALSVTDFINLVNEALLAVESVTVEGEVIDYKVIQNKWVVFDLKDEKSLVKCFMTIWNLKTLLEDGMLVRATGQPKLRPKGFFSFVVDNVQPSGEGALKRAFELLKQKLSNEGLFSIERKRSLPRFPERIALITSRDAAAFGDFKKVLAARQGGLTISLFHTAVQGEEAVAQIINNLNQANSSTQLFDVIVMIRGGGSMEDLQAFNDERVVRAVATSRIPTVVGIGHERDITLAELASDQRASTPSNAAELVVKSREELLLDLSHLTSRLQQTVHTQLDEKKDSINHAVSVLRREITTTRQKIAQTIFSLFALRPRFMHTIQHHRHHVVLMQTSMLRSMRNRSNNIHERLAQLHRLLQSFSPQAVLKRGYSITRLKDGPVVKHVKDIKSGSMLITQLSDGTVTSRTTDSTSSQLELGL